MDKIKDIFLLIACGFLLVFLLLVGIAGVTFPVGFNVLVHYLSETKPGDYFGNFFVLLAFPLGVISFAGVGAMGDGITDITWSGTGD